MKGRGILGVAVGLVALGTAGLFTASASDHDDGEADLKGRSLNLTDVYAFREDNQTGVGGDSDNLILVMNSNPRSVARQQYFFSAKGRYEFHLTRVSDKDATATGADDVIIRMAFGDPDTTGKQAVTLTTIKDGTETVSTTVAGGGPIMTTNLAGSTGDTALTVNSVPVGGLNIDLFAGLREDPFFFDVEQFFKVRGGAAGAFRTTSQAVDFTAGYNVNSIVLRVPLQWLSGPGAETTYDVWATVTHPNG